MDIKKLDKLRMKVLKGVEEEFTNELVPARFSAKDGEAIEELVVLYDGTDEGIDECLCEYFFLPTEAEDDVQFFVCLVNMIENLNKENLNELYKTVAALNTYLVTGTFAVDLIAESLVYKLTYPMRLDRADEKTMSEDVDLAIGMSTQMIDSFGYFLEEVNNGVRDAVSVIETVTGWEEDDE